MKGARLTDDPGVTGFDTPGAYWRERGCWYATTPNGLLANLSRHTVTEHDDGTISVSPSILVTTGAKSGAASWHGYLECGVWREC